MILRSVGMRRSGRISDLSSVLGFFLLWSAAVVVLFVSLFLLPVALTPAWLLLVALARAGLLFIILFDDPSAVPFLSITNG